MEIEQKIPVNIEDEMKRSYLDYAMSVIIGRALPDVRDGLKPVHRRVLWAMHELSNTHNKPYKKSARVTGDCIGKYHPHGDVAVYDTIVRMVQDFSMRMPLIDGQGNFGSVDGDAAAAMRYCVTGDTLVVCDRGLVPIKNLSDNGSEDIQLSVLSRDRKVNTAVKWFDSGAHPTLKITTRGGFSIQGTYNHPLLIWSKNEQTGAPEFQWKLLSQLKVGDLAVIDRTPDLLWPDTHFSAIHCWPNPTVDEANTSRIQTKILPGELTEDLAFILGALVAEGMVKERKIEFCNSDEELLAEFDRCWQRTFPDCRLHRFSREPNSYGKKPYQTREIHSSFCIEFLRKLGLLPVRSQDKTIPWSILCSPRPVVAAFLRAYFEGDGSISYSKKMVELSCISTSEILIQQLQVLLLRFGIASAKRFDRYRNTHKLYIRGLENYRLFQEEIGFFSARKKEKLASAIASFHKEYSATDFVPFISDFSRSHLNSELRWRGGREFVLKHNFDRYPNLEKHNAQIVATLEPDWQDNTRDLFEHLLDTEYLFDPISQIEDGGLSQVYSLRVESSCHSFVANGFINHNTEVRMAKISDMMLVDIEKETVDYQPNYDETLEEPMVLPTRFPNLLVNGASGIAVGMATNIPPHNLTEIIEATTYLIQRPDATLAEVMKFVPGPDFPTGAFICGQEGIKQAYETGRGTVVMRARAAVDRVGRNEEREAIVVTQIPYQVNKAKLIERIAELINDKKIEDISDLRDESDREGMRIVIELKRGAVAQVVLNNLYKLTPMQTTFGVINLAIVAGQPSVLGLIDTLQLFIGFRKEVVRRRTEYELRRAHARLHILEGLAKALDHMDAVIKLIRASRAVAEAREALMQKFAFSQPQAQAILDMQLHKLTGLERQKIVDELTEVKNRIVELEDILNNETTLKNVIVKELREVQKEFGDERRTQIVDEETELTLEDLIPDEDMVITITHGGYVKRTPLTTYRSQRRGGTGRRGMTTKAEDILDHIFVASTHSYVLIFTDKGQVYTLKVHEIPDIAAAGKGKAIVNLINLPSGEKVAGIVHLREFSKGRYVVMVTRRGTVKKTELSEFAYSRSKGIIAIGIDEGDELIAVELSDGKKKIFIATHDGMAIYFDESDVRSMGRQAYGVRGIELRESDYVVGVAVVSGNEQMLSVSEYGLGKRTPIGEYRHQSRGGVGVINMKVTDKTGPVVGVMPVRDDDEIMLISVHGKIIRLRVGDIRETGRSTQGVKLIDTADGDRVASASLIERQNEPIPEESDK